MTNWTVSFNEDKGAMQIVYDLTNIFLKPVIKPDLLPPDLIDQHFGHVLSLNDIFNMIVDNYLDILKQNTPMIVCIGFGFLFSLLR